MWIHIHCWGRIGIETKKKIRWWICCFVCFFLQQLSEGGAGTLPRSPPTPKPCEMCPHCFVQLPDYCESLSPSGSGCAHPCWARRDKGVRVLISITCCDTANAEPVPSFLQKKALGYLKHLAPFKHPSLASCQQHISSISTLFSCSTFKKQISDKLPTCIIELPITLQLRKKNIKRVSNL